MATRLVLAELVDDFRTQRDCDVAIESVGGVDAAKRVQAGEAFDVVVLAADAIDKLIASGHVINGSRVDLVRSGVALAVRAGAPHPDVTSEDGLRRAVEAARTLSFSTGPSGVHLAKVFERWGMGNTIKSKIVQAPPGVPVGNLVARGSGGGKFGFTKLGGIAARLADELASRVDHECRYVILGHLQRGGPPNTYDRLLATRFGVRAVRLVVEGKFGRMVSFQPPEVTDVPLSAAVNRIRKVPANGELIETGRSLGISFGDR